MCEEDRRFDTSVRGEQESFVERACNADDFEGLSKRALARSTALTGMFIGAPEPVLNRPILDGLNTSNLLIGGSIEERSTEGCSWCWELGVGAREPLPSS